MAKVIPGKEDFHETLRYFTRRIEITGVKLKLGRRVEVEELDAENYDAVIVATGVKPRVLSFSGADDPRVLSYIDVLAKRAKVGDRVAIIGAGGIGFDVAEFLAHEGESSAVDLQAFLAEWGIDGEHQSPGGLHERVERSPKRKITMCQRSEGKLGAGLGKTTGWIHRTALKHIKVEMLAEVSYERFDDEGLHIRVAGKARTLKVENVVICAGQLKEDRLFNPLKSRGIEVHVIGGAALAAELDAKRAIDEGTRLAARL